MARVLLIVLLEQFPNQDFLRVQDLHLIINRKKNKEKYKSLFPCAQARRSGKAFFCF